MANDKCIVGIYILISKPIFPIVVSIMGRCSLEYVWYFSLSGIFWTTTCLLINIGVVNQLPSQNLIKIHSSLICLKKKFHLQICINFSTRYEKCKNSYMPTCGYPCTIQTKLGLSPAIMPQWNVVVHFHPVSVMIRYNFKIIEIEYLPINRYSLFLLNLWKGQTWKVWHYHNITIRILLKHSVTFHSTQRHPNPHNLFTELIVKNVSVNPPIPIKSHFYKCTSINPLLPYFQDYFKDTETAVHYHCLPSSPFYSS